MPVAGCKRPVGGILIFKIIEEKKNRHAVVCEAVHPLLPVAVTAKLKMPPCVGVPVSVPLLSASDPEASTTRETKLRQSCEACQHPYSEQFRTFLHAVTFSLCKAASFPVRPMHAKLAARLPDWQSAPPHRQRRCGWYRISDREKRARALCGSRNAIH